MEKISHGTWNMEQISHESNKLNRVMEKQKRRENFVYLRFSVVKYESIAH